MKVGLVGSATLWQHLPSDQSEQIARSVQIGFKLSALEWCLDTDRIPRFDVVLRYSLAWSHESGKVGIVSNRFLHKNFQVVNST